MNRVVVGLAAFAFAMVAPSVFAQEHDHGEIGVYGNYFRLNDLGNTNFMGVGGRVGFNVAPRVQLEGQMTYDFAQNFTSSSTSDFSTTIVRSNLTLLHGLFGPKVDLGTDHARFFATFQGGFLRFGVANGSTSNSFTSSISGFGDSSTNGALYPGIGGEFYVGPVGVRVDVGDFIYWNAGGHNNLVVKFGPQIKF
ncbi:MAG TPA: hypothetical protein VGK48_06855 [Terriglobia bacterium]|jgi:hypothetical protein